MTWRGLAILLCLAGSAAPAQDSFPALYDVTGVAGDDVLNLRSGPSAGADKVGALSHDARDIEVLRRAEGADWGLVNTGETTGWAALRFLRRQAGQDRGAFPALTRCFGTEPFWTVTATDQGWRFDRMGEGTDTFAETWRGPAAGRSDRFGLTLSSKAGAATAVIGIAICGDGMSDRSYGYTIDLLRPGQSGPVLYSGCCTLAP